MEFLVSLFLPLFGHIVKSQETNIGDVLKNSWQKTS